MAVKKVAILALLGLISSDQVNATFNQVSQGVVRIELERHTQPHHEIEEVEESAEEDDQIQIEIGDESYA